MAKYSIYEDDGFGHNLHRRFDEYPEIGDIKYVLTGNRGSICTAYEFTDEGVWIEIGTTHN